MFSRCVYVAANERYALSPLRLIATVTRRLKGRELGVEALGGVPLRLGLAGAKALGPRRASASSGRGAWGARALSVTVSACNQALQATQSRRVVCLPISLVPRCLAWCCHWASGRLSFDRYTPPKGP